VSEAAAILARAGVEDPRREARLLLAHLLGIGPQTLLPADQPVDPGALGALVARRAAHEPLAYITGRRGFWTFEVEVNPSTLIPRADSETLVEAALEAWPDRDAVKQVLDLGTGTGCLLVAALMEFPSAYGVGVDRVAGAAALAARNAARLVPGRAGFVIADWAEPLNARFDLLLCNPPYIPTPDMGGLAPDVAHHEPGSALDGGVSGLDAYARLLPAIKALLNAGGTAIFELGIAQAQAVTALAKGVGFTRILTRPDLAGIPRALVLHAPA
jgi:release factor glutamine methyltransferase